jgi:hypothetical protein
MLGRTDQPIGILSTQIPVSMKVRLYMPGELSFIIHSLNLENAALA